jgi:hypothetical protein
MSTLEVALELAANFGLPVFPCRPTEETINGRVFGAKSPRTLHGFKDASTSVEAIEAWWRRWPDSLVGVPTGSVTNLLVVDIDPAGEAWYSENAEGLICGRIHRTRRGGYHLLYCVPAGTSISISAGKLASGVDVRADGGYIIWWPAAGLDVAGDIEDIGEAPRWLVETLVELGNRSSTGSRKANGHDGGVIAEGGRNDTLTREAGRLRRLGYGEDVLLAALRAINAERCSPALADEEVAAIARSVGRYSPSADGPASAWPEPVNFLRELAAPPFVPEDVPPQLGAFAFAYAKQTGIDPSICVAAAVTCAAAAINDEFAIVADSASGWMQSARLWFLSLAPSGAGKSPAQRAMLKPLHELQRDLHAHYQKQCDLLDKDDPKPPKPRILLADTTVEALSEALRDNPRGLLIANDEFEGFLGSLDQYRRSPASRDRGEWLRAFDGGPHTIERVQRGSVFVPNFGVSLLTATTPTALAKVARLLPEDGLLQRFLLVVARRQVDGERVAELDSLRRDFEALLQRMYHLTPRKHRGKVPMMEEATEVFASWRRQIRGQQEALDGLDPALGAHLAKFPTFALRLALVFHVARVGGRDEEHPDPAVWPVTAETMERAFRFLDRCRRHAVITYLALRGGSEAFDLARDLARAIIALGGSSVARRDFLRHVWGFRKADPSLQSRAIDLLVDLGWLRESDDGYRKSEPTRFLVNPSIHEQYVQIAEQERKRRAAVREVIKAAADVA